LTVDADDLPVMTFGSWNGRVIGSVQPSMKQYTQRNKNKHQHHTINSVCLVICATWQKRNKL